MDDGDNNYTLGKYAAISFGAGYLTCKLFGWLANGRQNVPR